MNHIFLWVAIILLAISNCVMWEKLYDLGEKHNILVKGIGELANAVIKFLKKGGKDDKNK